MRANATGLRRTRDAGTSAFTILHSFRASVPHLKQRRPIAAFQQLERDNFNIIANRRPDTYDGANARHVPRLFRASRVAAGCRRAVAAPDLDPRYTLAPLAPGRRGCGRSEVDDGRRTIRRVIRTPEVPSKHVIRLVQDRQRVH